MRLAEALSRVQAFIFDLDGTLLDSVDAHIESWFIAFREVLKASVDYEEVKGLIGLGGRDIVKKLFGVEGLRRYRAIRYVKDRTFLNEVRSGRAILYPSALKLLKTLKAKGYRLGIATSTPTYMALHLIDYYGLTQYIDVLVCGDEVPKGKPDPEIFSKALRLLGIPAQSAVVVGDTPYDILPAMAIGSLPVLVNKYEGALCKAPCISCFPTLEDLTSSVSGYLSSQLTP
jgi:HAD superfamily hydrolase (TIGR01509 family)